MRTFCLVIHFIVGTCSFTCLADGVQSPGRFSNAPDAGADGLRYHVELLSGIPENGSF